MAIVTAAILIAQQVAGKATRDALFLSSFHSSALPSVMAAGAVLSLGAIFWLSKIMARRAPHQVMPVLFALNALVLAIAWLLGLGSPRSSAVVVYLQMAAFGPAMISTFWSLINERFDPHSGKRAVARVTVGGTIGGVLGGFSAWRSARLLQPATLVAVLAGVSVVGLVCTLMIRGRRETADSPKSEPTAELTDVSALDELKRSALLRNLAALVAVSAAISALLDYVLSAQAVVHFGKGQPLLSFFALLWLGVSVASFVLQLLVGEVALEKLGLALSIAILPGVLLLGSAFGLLVPGLVSAALLRGADAVQRNTLFRSAYELLYTPVAKTSKRITKAVIDVGCDRLGTVVGSGVASLALFVVAPSASKVALCAVVVMALAALPLVRRIHVGYVGALKESLKAGSGQPALQLSELSAPDSQSRPAGAARERLIEQVEALRPGGLTAILDERSGVAPAAPPSPGVAALALKQSDELLSAVQDLLSADETRARRALAQLQPAGPSLSCAVLLLGHAQLHSDALQALQGVAAAAVGQLTDALLTPEMDFAVRRRVPRVLAAAATQRAADGLLLGLADDRFEVRYECGRALSRIAAANRDVSVSRQVLIDAVLREVRTPVLETASAELEDDSVDQEPNALVDVLLRDRVDRSLEYIFLLLSVHLEREPLRMAFRALYHTDLKHRGTALEYLDAILPTEVRDAVWPLLGHNGPLPLLRPAREILEELALSQHTSEGPK